MSLFRRGNTWWIYLVASNGRKVRQSANTTDKREAQAAHDILKAKLLQMQHNPYDYKRTWQDAGERWLVEMQHKASINTDKLVVALFNKHIGNTKLTEIGNTLVQEVVRTQEKRISPATINRYLEIVRAILRKAVKEWDWLDKAPHITMRKLDNKRVRYITKQQAEVLLSELPEHQRNLAEFALLTGLRQRNITQLQWEQVDLDRAIAWVHPDESKTRKAIGVPLNDRAVELLHQLVGNHPVFVFTYESRPIKNVNTKAWRKALG